MVAGPYLYADILDFKNLQELVVNRRIDWIIHFSALLSAIGEVNIPLAMRVNIEGLHNIMEISKQYRIKLFVPSTIGKTQFACLLIMCIVFLLTPALTLHLNDKTTFFCLSKFLNDKQLILRS